MNEFEVALLQIISSENFRNFMIAGLTLIVGLLMGYVYQFASRKDVAKFLSTYSEVIDLASGIVISIAKNRNIITAEEWEIYEAEAASRGLDVRLVAALYELDEALTVIGVDLPEKTLLHIIQSEYDRLKAGGNDELPSVG